MSRSGYADDREDNWRFVMWRGAVNSALRGKRGQAFLREALAALDALPDRALAAESLQTAGGEFCTLGAVGRLRGIDMAALDPEDYTAVAKAFGISEAMAREIVYENDEAVDERQWVDVEICGPMRPGFPEYGRHSRTRSVQRDNVAEDRWRHMRSWVQKNLKSAEAA
jgi:hypothetical protein